jgi:glyoxylase-like metal-dependent hydrolase (beta-lactamase superfamily II)
VRITVRLFARLRDIAGAPELARDVAPGSTIGAVWRSLADDFPELARYERSVSSAVNADYAKMDRVLSDGDEVAGFRVVHAPGHSPGEVIFFRESDRVAICGDVIRNLSYATARRKLAEPPEFFNYDTAQNRESIRKLAALQPSMILPGHGHAVTDMDEFQRFAAAVPSG